MRNFLIFCVLLTIFGCGGGGGPATPNIGVSGRVLNIETGGQFSTAASVQTSVGVANTSISDGSFTVSAPRGVSQLTVNPPVTSGFSSFVFGFPLPLTAAQNDVGDLWVGPQRVTLRGTLRNASNGDIISGARVTFAGQYALSNSSGLFEISNVAYSSTNTASFLGLLGRVTADTFFATEFTTGGALASAGIVSVGEILLTPLSSDTPPGLPYTIWGNITPRASASGTIVTLRDSSNVVVRRFTVGTDARYQLWVPTGAYTLSFQNGTLSAPNQSVTLTTSTDVVQANANLN